MVRGLLLLSTRSKHVSTCCALKIFYTSKHVCVLDPDFGALALFRRPFLPRTQINLRPCPPKKSCFASAAVSVCVAVPHHPLPLRQKPRRLPPELTHGVPRVVRRGCFHARFRGLPAAARVAASSATATQQRAARLRDMPARDLRPVDLRPVERGGTPRLLASWVRWGEHRGERGGAGTAARGAPILRGGAVEGGQR